MRITSGGHGFVPSSVRRNSHRYLPLLLLLLLFAPGFAKAQTTVNIHTIQTKQSATATNLDSAYLGQPVTTEGIVTAKLADGFYIENSDTTTTCPRNTATLNCWDTDNTTAEGIFVLVPAGVTATVAVGDLVTVTGTVQPSNTSSYAGTEVVLSANPTVSSSGNAIPAAVPASVVSGVTTAAFGQWLQFEGMRIPIASLTTVSGTGGTLTESTETVVSNGQFWGVLTSGSGTTARPFREKGISMLDAVPTTAPATVQRWDGNPELLFIDSGIRGGTPLDVTANATISNLVGIVDYHENTEGYTGILLDPTNGYGTITGGSTAKAAAVANSGVLTVATQDLGRFFFTSKTANDAVAITAAAYARRLAKTAASIVNYENTPDIVAVQEAENEQTLLDLSSAVSAAAAAAGKTDPTYNVMWMAGNDSTGLASGVLFNPAKVNIIAAEQYGQNLTYTAPSGTTYPLFDRPPFILHVKVLRVDTNSYPDSTTKSLIVVVNNMLDRTNIDNPTLGNDVRYRREAQAEYIAQHVIQTFQNNGESVISVGNYNSFQHEVQDGFVDAMGAIDGNPVATNLVTLASPVNLTVPNAINLTGTSQTAQPYTYVESGSAEQPDHILVTSDFANRSSIDYARVNADFPASGLNDASTALHNADHDPLIGYFVIPQFSSLTLTSSENPSFVGDSVTFTAKLSSPAGGTPTGTISFSIDGQVVSTVTLDASLTATYTTAGLAVGSHKVVATYSGDLAHDPATASLTQVVVAYIPTQTTLTCSPNPAQYGTTVVCTATVASALGNHPGPTTGSITFYDGTTALGTVALSGSAIATLSTSSLAAGLHPITAVYARMAPYDTSTSNTVNEIIWADFSISVTPPSNSVYTGEKATYTVTITPGAGFTFDTPLSCSNLPDFSSCSFTPNPVPNSKGTSTWVIQTSAPSQSAAANRSPRLPWQLPAGSVGLAAIALFVLPKRFRRRGAFLATLVVLTFNMMLGCSSPRRLTGGTTPGTYTVTVTAAVDESGTGYIVSHSATANLTVKSLF